MHLSNGDRVGRYEILEALGVGGMGEVYRARDRELDREVAVKVLPEAVTRDPDRLARFKREAKAVARLSHPSILEIYDLGRERDVAFAVTELLEGEDLGDHLRSVGGPMPWKEVRRIGAAVADGLAIFHQAVEADPMDPLAYAALGEAYVNLGHGTQARREFFPRARAAAQRALELDPMNARARSVLADVMVYYDWNFEEAEGAFQRALQLDSNLPWAHFHYSWFLARFGRFEEAVAEHERAKELDPLTPAHTAFLGWLYLYDGMLDEAMGEVRATFELNPNSPVGHFVAAEIYTAREQHQEAIEAAGRAAELNPDLRFGLARAYAFAGRNDEARALLAKIESEKMTVWGGFTTPSVYVALGDIDGAFRVLEQAYEIRSPWLPWIGVDFLYEPLRGDPRLDDLLRRME